MNLPSLPVSGLSLLVCGFIMSSLSLRVRRINHKQEEPGSNVDVSIDNSDIFTASKYNSSLFLRANFHIDLLSYRFNAQHWLTYPRIDKPSGITQ